jgi:4-amino-4-deoxy-L-arabinose transferase-like glycosyltransferase
MGITPSDQRLQAAESPQAFKSGFWIGSAIAAIALVVFGLGLTAKSFEDEFAYITQSYFADLFFAGRFGDRAWISMPAYDLQPLPKYLIGFSLRVAGLPVPTVRDAREWYKSYRPFGTYPTLIVSRIPFVFLGVLGVVAIFGCGTLLIDRRAGTIAAFLLMLDPLYRLHAHRAMADAPCEAFMMTGLAFFFWTWRRLWVGAGGAADLIAPCLAGAASGLALLCKFNGLLGLFIIAAWTVLSLIMPRLAPVRKLAIAGASIAAFVVSMAVAVALNPFMTAQPRETTASESADISHMNAWKRFRFQVNHRLELSNYQKRSFPDDALHTLADKCKVVVVQGLGRFGPFGPSDSDSTVRFDVRQDWGLVVWGPAVFLGMLMALEIGLDQFRTGQPPTALATAVWALVSWIVVTIYLPMAWNRYLLPIQSGNILLVSLLAVAAWDKFWLRRSAPGART